MKLRVGDRVYTFDQSRMLNTELIAIEREIGMTGLEWEDALNRGSSLAITGLVWILKRRYDGDPTIKFSDVLFDANEVEELPEDDESGKGSISDLVPEKPEATNGTASNSSHVTDYVPGSPTG